MSDVNYAYVSTDPLFRSLTLKEVKEFKDHANRVDPDPIGSWNVFHPVCRMEWIRRGIMPRALALTWKFNDGNTCVGYYLNTMDDGDYAEKCDMESVYLECRRIDGGMCVVSSDKVSEATQEDKEEAIKYFRFIIPLNRY